jgi:nitric oxide synthase oxygenase domain/subunit
MRWVTTIALGCYKLLSHAHKVAESMNYVFSSMLRHLATASGKGRIMQRVSSYEIEVDKKTDHSGLLRYTINMTYS